MKRILTLLILSLLFSCNKEDLTPEANPHTFITVETNIGELYTGKRFYFATTLDGELLAYKQLENQEINVLYTENAIPDKFNVHRLYVSNDGEIRFLESFFNTNQTSFSNQPICENPIPKTGNCTIHISGPTYSRYMFSYPGGAYVSYSPNGFYTINHNIETSLYEGYNFLFTFLKREQQYYYKYFLDLNPNEIYDFELDPNTMDTNYSQKILNAPEGMLFLNQSSIQSVIIGGLCYNRVCQLYSEISIDSTKLSTFVTPIGLEKYYKSYIHMLVEDNKKYTYQKHGDLPESIPTLDFDITNSSLEDYNNLSLSTSGSFDVISGTFRMETNAKNWRFYSDNADMLKFPLIPAEITEQYPTLTSTTYFETSTIMGYISLNDYGVIANYSDFIADFERNKYLDENKSLQTLTVSNY